MEQFADITEKNKKVVKLAATPLIMQITGITPFIRKLVVIKTKPIKNDQIPY